MPSRGQHGSKVPRSRQAAEMYLDGRLGIEALRQRFGLGRTTIWYAVDKLRKERAAVSVP